MAKNDTGLLLLTTTLVANTSIRDSERAVKNNACKNACKSYIYKTAMAKNDTGLLLLTTTLVAFIFLFTRNHFTQHNNTIAIHESDPRETFTVLERVANEWLLRLERCFCHLVGLQCMRIFHFLSTGLFAHLPFQLGNTASRATTTHEANGRIPHFDFVRDIKHLDLCIEFLRLSKCCVFLVYHHIARARHIVLVQTFYIQSNVITWIGCINTRMMHLDCKHLASTRIRGGVRWQKDYFFARLHYSLLHTACQHITHALDLVNARDWHAHWCTHRSLWHAAHLVKNIIHRIDMNGFLTHCNIEALPPIHVIRLFQEIISHPPRDWHVRSVFLDEIFFPADLH